MNLTNYIKDEINTPCVLFEQNVQKYARTSAKPIDKNVGKKRAEYLKS